MQFTILLEVIKITWKKGMDETGNLFSNGLEEERRSMGRCLPGQPMARIKSLAVSGRQKHPLSCLPNSSFRSIIASSHPTVSTDQHFPPSGRFCVRACVQIVAPSLAGLIQLCNLLFPFNSVAEHCPTIFGFAFLPVSWGYAAKVILFVLPSA